MAAFLIITLNKILACHLSPRMSGFVNKYQREPIQSCVIVCDVCLISLGRIVKGGAEGPTVRIQQIIY
jgi:hypothetical protein